MAYGAAIPAYNDKPEAAVAFVKFLSKDFWKTAGLNLDDQTIFFLGYVTPIDSVEGASIRFGGRQIVDYGFNVAISGNINRATGRMDATLIMSDPMQPADANTATIHYDLVCRQAAIE